MSDYIITNDDQRIIETLKLPTENYRCVKCGKDYIIREGDKVKVFLWGRERI
ncbi:MAG: hypothetical protein GX638_00470 [Crenarchaeota archaeon]|nr:hypothetical protein [Thermoproteota archaeon]